MSRPRSTNGSRSAPGDQTVVTAILERLGRSDLIAVGDGDRPIPTGFEPLDHELEGGLRPGQLVVLGGPPGVGKTAFAMQLARNAADHGTDVVFACYEHDTAQLFGRLIGCEIGALGTVGEPEERAGLRSVIRDAMSGAWGTDAPAARLPRVRAALSRAASYSDRLLLVSAGRHTDLDELDRLAEATSGGGMLIVDYLQKVPAGNVSLIDRASIVTEELKALALRHHMTVVALSSAGGRSLEHKRIGLPSLQGAAALGYEADVVLIMNEKRDIVSRVHVNFDPQRLTTFSHWVIVSIEKNRSGPAPIDLEFPKMLEYFRFDPAGRYVTEKLIDDVLYLD